ncbi:MAG: hypothetical protein Q4G39_03445 [Brachymonas sp.]|nr:hypothetical protein [Brachymonas sp.]
MSANAAGFDFSQFVPGFDFLKQMGQTPGVSPALSQWVAPTLDPKEIGRRIQELKTVQFWLEQNTTALKATIQALEVQQLTCQTLQNMNAGMAGWAQHMQEAMAPAAATAAPTSTGPDEPPASDASEKTGAQAQSAKDDAAPPAADAALQAVMEQAGQWWNGLFQTFGQIATQAQQEVAQRQEAFAQAQEAAAAPAAPKAAAAKKPRAAAKPRSRTAKTSTRKTAVSAKKGRTDPDKN